MMRPEPPDRGTDRWAAVERYFADLLFPPDAVLDAALADSVAAGLPPINVSAAQGRLLALLAEMIGARRILEIGTLGGYSGIWLARALPAGGRLVTLEVDSGYAEIARRNFERAGLSDRVDLRVGRAEDTLPVIESQGLGPFDFIFVDADKPRYTDYLGWSIRLSRRGGVIVVDNIVRDGDVVNERSADAKVQGVRRFNAALAAERRVDATAIQLVGAKGYDGFAVMIVKDPDA
jgi:predicted O-methyltransferase YrrM